MAKPPPFPAKGKTPPGKPGKKPMPFPPKKKAC